MQCAKGRGLTLPGGKHEPPETYKEAAARELEEETGLIAINQEFLYQGPNFTDGYTVMCFLTEVKDMNFRDTDEGKPLITTWDRLISESEFKSYYEVLHDVYLQQLFCKS